MSSENKSEPRFPHHTFQREESVGKYRLVSSSEAVAVGDSEPGHVRDAAEQLRRAKVSAVILIHGTFTGDDAVGLVREIARLSPRLAEKVKGLGKHIVDHLAGEVGNYTASFADHLSLLLNHGQPTPISVTRFHWSGENHHLGRADGMIDLLDLLTSETQYSDRRLLLWAHSHGGNLLALLSLLLGTDAATRTGFFEAAKSHYRDPIMLRLNLPQWEAVRKRLCEEGVMRAFPRLDVVDFGTPLRYRWNRRICPNLLHFVQHRPLDSDYPARASMPRSLQQLLCAAGGDYVQHLGIGGTDFLHSVFAWRSWQAERRLRMILERSIRRRELRERLKQGRRVSSDGTTLLVDYPETETKSNQLLLGHGVYTQHEWLPFHLNTIAAEFYADNGPGRSSSRRPI